MLNARFFTVDSINDNGGSARAVYFHSYILIDCKKTKRKKKTILLVSSEFWIELRHPWTNCILVLMHSHAVGVGKKKKENVELEAEVNNSRFFEWKTWFCTVLFFSLLLAFVHGMQSTVATNRLMKSIFLFNICQWQAHQCC